MTRLGLLMSNTGSGHRAAAVALDTALHHRYPGEFAVHYVDVLREFGVPPWNRAPEILPFWIKYNQYSFNKFVDLSSRVMATRIGRDALPSLASLAGHRRFARRYRWDAMVAFHVGCVGLAVGARRVSRQDTPVITVITDLGRPHAGWYHPEADLTLVPSEDAFQRGLSLGMAAERMRIVGPPVHPKFVLYRCGKDEARESLGWKRDLPTLLLVGGGLGAGDLGRLARAMDSLDVPVQIAVVTGSNEGLRRQLERSSWRNVIHVYGSIDNMEVMMRGADLLVGKGGAATVAEAAVSGLPMVLLGTLTQERPNVDLVVRAGAGIGVVDPCAARDAVRGCITQPQRLAFLSERARAFCPSDSCWRLADEVAVVCNGVGVFPGGESPCSPRR